MNMSIQI